jgi:hypothetical protein
LASTPDDWESLGALDQFPIVLHARGSFLYDINPDSLQKIVISAMADLQREKRQTKITVADRPGYFEGVVKFRLGIANGVGFDVLDAHEEDRVLKRIENLGPFNTMDLAFNLDYKINDRILHKVHRDRYILRLVFQPGRFEVLVHHIKGIRRVEPDELVRLFVERINSVLARGKYDHLELENLSST